MPRKKKETIPLPTAVVEQQYRIARVAELLDVKPAFVYEQCDLGDQTKGREGIYPTYFVSPKVRLVPASAILNFLRRRQLA